MNSVIAATVCPACKTDNLRENVEIDSFPYGDEGIEISAAIPVLRCASCAFVYTDGRAEKARHVAVCKHLDLLPPDEILHIRKSVLGMSREAFHAAYGLSSASVERWENGKLFQNEAADTLIRALTDPAMAKSLDRRKLIHAENPATIEIGNVVYVRFPHLARSPAQVEAAQERAKEFNLRIKAS